MRCPSGNSSRRAVAGGARPRGTRDAVSAGASRSFFLWVSAIDVRRTTLHILNASTARRTPRFRAVANSSPAMGFSRLLLLFVVAAISFLSLAAFAQHLVFGEAISFPGGVPFAIVTGILAAICVRRQEGHDLHN